MSNLQLTLVLAAASILGIIGMLLFEGVADFLSLLLAALPLYFSALRFWQHRSRPRRTR